MSKTRLTFHAARRSNRGGFTLVELLVVIGIIAILAGVALGPITGGLETAKENAAMQTARTLGLMEFQYAVDNDSTYPGTGATTKVDMAKLLLTGKYITDPGIFYVGGGSQIKFSGSDASSTINADNISWDFMAKSGSNGNVGLSTADPDQLPIVWSTGNTITIPATAGVGGSALTTGLNPFGAHGIPVCYKSNSAKFQKVKNVDGKTVDGFIDQSFDPNGVTYTILK